MAGANETLRGTLREVENTSLALTAALLMIVGGLIAIVPIGEVGFVLQFMGVGAAVGMFLAYRLKRRDPSVEPFSYTTRWAGVGVLVGLAIVLADLAR